jgi:hypothetical protein
VTGSGLSLSPGFVTFILSFITLGKVFGPHQVPRGSGILRFWVGVMTAAGVAALGIPD